MLLFCVDFMLVDEVMSKNTMMFFVYIIIFGCVHYLVVHVDNL